MSHMLATEQINRYDRQIKLPGIGTDGQERLSSAKVLIVGVGGLGCPAAQYLVAAGTGTVGLMDYDQVDISNLHRQILFTEADIGKPKAEAAANALQKLNREVEITTYAEWLDRDNALSLFENYDLIIDGTDNFQTKYLINDACVLVNRPWVYASIYKFQGQLSVFNYQNGPTYRCLFPKSPSHNINCEETGVLGVLPGILGTLQATEAMKIILQLGTTLSGKLKIVDTLTMQDQIISFERDDEQINRVKDRGLALEAINCELQNNDLCFLDVREPFEQPNPVSKKILNIPLGQLGNRYHEIPKDQVVQVYCQTGIRSEKAVEFLSREYGFTNLLNVKGGIQSILK
jgi:sulfur-carrier protein adenylyltransferase/sulfurtransferase